MYLVGAGPGDHNLLTIKAAELIKSADVVLYDRLVGDDTLSTIKPNRRVYVGRSVGDDTKHQNKTNEMMASYAKKGMRVVRLKGGDPFMFGRGGEEAEFLRSQNIKFEIVPGITSGIGSAAYAGIPLTHRGLASSVIFVTGHESEKDAKSVKWKNIAGAADTIVVMMGLSRIGEICAELIEGGLSNTTPVAVIQDGTTKHHKMVVGTISDISKTIKNSNIKPPANIIIGRVVELSNTISWR